MILLLQLIPAVADQRLKVAEPQRPLLLLCLLEAAALCIAVGAAPLAPPQIRQMAGSLLPQLYSSAEARLVQVFRRSLAFCCCLPLFAAGTCSSSWTVVAFFLSAVFPLRDHWLFRVVGQTSAPANIRAPRQLPVCIFSSVKLFVAPFLRCFQLRFLLVLRWCSEPLFG